MQHCNLLLGLSKEGIDARRKVLCRNTKPGEVVGFGDCINCNASLETLLFTYVTYQWDNLGIMACHV